MSRASLVSARIYGVGGSGGGGPTKACGCSMGAQDEAIEPKGARGDHARQSSESLPRQGDTAR